MSVGSSGQNMTRQCPQCGAPVSAGALEGLCPACLLRQGASAETATQGGSAPFEPPDIAEIARLFPQLEIVAFIGKGGMGAVYKARQPALDRIVALKILPPQAAGGPQFAGRFAREARALARLNHPNIVSVHDFGQVNGMPFFVMEFVDGLNLREMERAGQLTPREALQIVPQICEALQFAHDEGVVHRDIKPENILLDKKGRVKIADFGIAKIMEAGGQDTDAGAPVKAGDAPGAAAAGAGQPRLTEQGKVIGTPNYMAPEQVETPQSVDHRADIFSLGVVFYEMLTGELPLGKFAPPSSRASGVTVDVRLDEVVLRALEREPERRYQQASQVRTAVQNIADQPPAQSLHRLQGVNYRSRATLLGLPLVHVATGVDPATNRPRVARGIIAIGGIAQGVIAFGGVAMGGFTFGGVSIGVVAFGGATVGIAAVGGAALAMVMALGGLAVAPIAIGGGAIGYFAYGGGVLGVHPLGANISDEIARHFFLPWAAQLPAAMNYLFPALLLPLLAVMIGVPLWLQRKAVSISPNSPAQPGPGRVQGAKQSAAMPASLGAAAVFFAGLAGVLGAVALFKLPAPPQVLVWSILTAAVLGIVLGMASRKTASGRRAVVVGVVNLAIWLAIATLYWLRFESLSLPPPGSLAGYWEGEGDANDSSSNGNHGTFVGGARYGEGKVGKAFDFNGSSYVDAPDSERLNPTRSITLTAWIYPRTFPYSSPIIKKAGEGRWADHGYALEIAGATGVIFAVYIDHTHWAITPYAPVPLNQWSHAAGVYDGTNIYVYVNGVPAGPPLYAPGKIAVAGNDLQLGHDAANPSRYFDGLIDEAAVYDTALSGAQIQTLYELGNDGRRPPLGPPVPARTNSATGFSPCPAPPGLVGWWTADGNAADQTGLNHGIIHGGVKFVPGKIGQAFQFDGASGYVTVPASDSLNVGNGPGFTIEGWLNPADLSTPGPVLEWNDDTGNLRAHFWINVPVAMGGTGPGSIFANIVDVGGIGHCISSPANFLAAGEFNHVALTYSKLNGTATLYLDGNVVADLEIGVFTPGTWNQVYLGTRSTTSYFYKGLMDEMSVYNTALSASQIRAIYRADSAGKSPPPAGPAVSLQPPTPAKSPGGTVTFNVAATGAGPPGYQWNFSPTAGSASAETWSPTLAPGEKPDFQKILNEVKELMDQGHYEEALQREIWYFNHSRFEPGQGGVRLSFALADWIELGRRYPRAKQALMEIRDRGTHEIEAGRGYSELFSEVQAINHQLQDDDATYALFLTMRTNDPQLAGQCYMNMESSLVAKGEYQWCYDHMGDPQTRFDRIHQFLDMELENRRRMAENQQRTAQRTAEIYRQRGMTNMGTFTPPDNSGMLGRMATNGFVGGTCQLIEILVATGHADVAENIRDQAIKVVDDARLHSAVEDAQTRIHAKQAGKTGARAGFERTPADPPAAVERAGPGAGFGT